PLALHPLSLHDALPICPEPLSLTVLDTRFLAYFPDALDFLEGLKLRMKSLAPIHLRRIERLVDIYGTTRAKAAIARAQSYRNYRSEEHTSELQSPDHLV